MSSPAVTPALIIGAKHLVAAKYYALASFVMLTYDILLTFSWEVDKIWKKKFTGVTLLWFLNRWIFFLAVIPTVASFQDPAFVGGRYFRYPGYIATFQRAVIGSVFILRTYCIYGRNFKVAGLIAVFLVTELVLKLVSTIVWGEAVVLPPGFVACVLSVAPKNAKKYIVFWVFELATDAVVLGLTVYRSYTAYKASNGFSHTHLLRVIVKDGIIYFLVMFAANLTTVLMYLIAAQDLKASNADFGVMINSLMTARLILNLKAATGTGAHQRRHQQPHHSGFTGAQTSWEAHILGNIGNEFEGGGGGSGGESTAFSSASQQSTAHGAAWKDEGSEYELPVVVRRAPGGLLVR